MIIFWILMGQDRGQFVDLVVYTMYFGYDNVNICDLK